VKASHSRKESDGYYRDKESEVSRKEYLSYQVLKFQAEIRRSEAERRLNEESGLIKTLKKIVRRLNKKIADT